ncbi:MAG: hypothetical protein HYW05_02945 [Candidatus Diapherotrites archaeon]|nr:hypothetical protein [Candidatus Diapherotrites archaeon]
MRKPLVFGFAALAFILILLSGCVQQGGAGKTPAELASDKCTALCEIEKGKGTDLSAGPCLSNSAAEGWVCDVAHSPRAEIDNSPANQCPEFGKTASHFVEVDGNCRIIRAA